MYADIIAIELIEADMKVYIRNNGITIITY